MFVHTFNQFRARRSFLYLELKSTHTVVHVCLMAFPDSLLHVVMAFSCHLKVFKHSLDNTTTLRCATPSLPPPSIIRMAGVLAPAVAFGVIGRHATRIPLRRPSRGYRRGFVTLTESLRRCGHVTTTVDV